MGNMGCGGNRGMSFNGMNPAMMNQSQQPGMDQQNGMGDRPWHHRRHHHRHHRMMDPNQMGQNQPGGFGNFDQTPSSFNTGFNNDAASSTGGNQSITIGTNPDGSTSITIGGSSQNGSVNAIPQAPSSFPTTDYSGINNTGVNNFSVAPSQSFDSSAFNTSSFPSGLNTDLFNTGNSFNTASTTLPTFPTMPSGLGSTGNTGFNFNNLTDPFGTQNITGLGIQNNGIGQFNINNPLGITSNQGFNQANVDNARKAIQDAAQRAIANLTPAEQQALQTQPIV
jgi:hypothetical protein